MPDNTLYTTTTTHCASACFLWSPARTAASPTGHSLPGTQRLRVINPLRRAEVPLCSSPSLASPFKTDWKIPMRLLKAREQKCQGHRQEGLQHPHDAALTSETKRPWTVGVSPTRCLYKLLLVSPLDCTAQSCGEDLPPAAQLRVMLDCIIFVFLCL